MKILIIALILLSTSALADQFLYGDHVKVVEAQSLYDKCEGKVIGGRVDFLEVELTKCPHEEYPNRVVSGGKEYFKVIK